ncbi:dihydroneopterin aldolase [Bradyrhizobium sp. AUGA SZCCT0177]|uniref:dihydroneopterin aldolase n=1 Tax=Bradyrhizobium sp. AUGA SZCCT0177 TaxID=2807665 RepID=UPI001BAD0A3A|nr:dihydroneopterin aldolase [Bradyrhizobium sp. AUGA SZCCT0177]MBR1281553.1 dihydroneopterin aldolase [Bradyrhizobium sp. AUGA SZCCT0177]
MEAKYLVHGYRGQAAIGCAEEEHGIRQEVVIHLAVFVDPDDDIFEDTRSMPYDYQIALDVLDSAFQEGHWILQEALAKAIADRILAHPRVTKVEVHTIKVQRYPNTEGVGFHLTASRP